MPVEHIDTVIGANVQLKGSLHMNGTLHIHGTVTGDVSTDGALLIGETAIVNGPVVAKQVEIAGKVYGSVNAQEQLELQPHGFVKGDIVTERLSIKPGGVFIGACSMPGLESEDSEQAAPKRLKAELEV